MVIVWIVADRRNYSLKKGVVTLRNRSYRSQSRRHQVSEETHEQKLQRSRNRRRGLRVVDRVLLAARWVERRAGCRLRRGEQSREFGRRIAHHQDELRRR